jgi:TPR repeat protein
MQQDLIDEDIELSIPDEGNRYRTFYVRETEEGYTYRLTNDPQRAASFVRAEAVNGSIPAQVAWGHMLLDGYGVAKDAEAALRWFKIAARSGNADALNMVGRCFECGWGVAADPEEAVRWFHPSADKGHAWARYNLGKLLARGHAGNRDPRVALTLLVSAARRGVPKAMNMLGRFREDGVVGQPKPRSAARWFERAARHGCFRGQFHHARYLVEAGRIEDAEKSFRASLAQAPQKYRRDALAMLRNHPEERIRQIALEVPVDQEVHPA